MLLEVVVAILVSVTVCVLAYIRYMGCGIELGCGRRNQVKSFILHFNVFAIVSCQCRHILSVVIATTLFTNSYNPAKTPQR